MGVDFDKLRDWRFEDQVHEITPRDVILYALGVGLGSPADDPDQLGFLYERGLKALPTMASVMGYRGFWLEDPATGVDWRHVLHGEQKIRLFRPLPVEGFIRSRQRVSALVDRGVERGAHLLLERTLHDESGQLLAQIDHMSILRADGGFGRSVGVIEPAHSMPSGDPDLRIDVPVSERAALIYRLSGDQNPLHIDPRMAATAGFRRPILHGLCTFGIIGHAVLRSCAGYDPDRISMMRGRFTAPVYPGETIRVEIWRRGVTLSMRARAVERDLLVFDRGHVELTPAGTAAGPQAEVASRTRLPAN